MIFIKLTQEILQFGKLKLIEEKHLHVLMMCVWGLCSAFVSFLINFEAWGAYNDDDVWEKCIFMMYVVM